jgi:DNA-binding MarR family transcriptional regulator
VTQDPTADDVAVALHLSIGLLKRRWRQLEVAGELSTPQASALARLDRGGPATASALAKLEEISPQSMGATLATLEERGLLQRATDPNDGRRSVLSLTAAGREALRDRRNARTHQLAEALDASCTHDELAQLLAVAPLLERLAQSL